MPKMRAPHSPENREQVVELARGGRSQETTMCRAGGFLLLHLQRALSGRDQVEACWTAFECLERLLHPHRWHCTLGTRAPINIFQDIIS